MCHAQIQTVGGAGSGGGDNGGQKLFLQNLLPNQREMSVKYPPDICKIATVLNALKDQPVALGGNR